MLEPDGFSINEHLFERAIDLKRKHVPGGPHKLSADKHRRDGGVAAHAPQCPLHFPASSVVIELVHRRAGPQLIEERLDAVAHAARALGEDHRSLL